MSASAAARKPVSGRRDAADTGTDAGASASEDAGASVKPFTSTHESDNAAWDWMKERTDIELLRQKVDGDTLYVIDDDHGTVVMAIQYPRGGRTTVRRPKVGKELQMYGGDLNGYAVVKVASEEKFIRELGLAVQAANRYNARHRTDGERPPCADVRSGCMEALEAVCITARIDPLDFDVEFEDDEGFTTIRVWCLGCVAPVCREARYSEKGGDAVLTIPGYGSSADVGGYACPEVRTVPTGRRDDLLRGFMNDSVLSLASEVCRMDDCNEEADGSGIYRSDDIGRCFGTAHRVKDAIHRLRDSFHLHRRRYSESGR